MFSDFYHYKWIIWESPVYYTKIVRSVQFSLQSLCSTFPCILWLCSHRIHPAMVLLLLEVAL
uniref:Uncharacterized protein n=1 Tax=Arundo donax TaxID=35708 RepID=A0A0A9HQ67_ARUDO